MRKDRAWSRWGSSLLALLALAAGCGDPPMSTSVGDNGGGDQPFTAAPPAEDGPAAQDVASVESQPAPPSVATSAMVPSSADVQPRIAAKPAREDPSLAPPGPATSPAPPPEPAPPAFDIDAFLASLPEGAIAFNAPEEVKYKEPSRVRLIIQPGLSEGAIQDEFFRTGTTPEGEVRTAPAALSAEMEARLVSSSLTVVALDPERQAVSASQPTEWRWDVTGTEGGQHELALTLYAIPPDRGSVRRVKSFEEVIRVKVPLTVRVAGFVSDHGEWLWTLVVAPIAGWLLARYRRSREPGG